MYKKYSKTYWQNDDIDITNNFSKLERTISVDVVIVGGGISGISAAYYLAKAGKKVAVIEKENLACHETSRSTAFLSPRTSLDSIKITDKNSYHLARINWKSCRKVIEELERIIKTENILCEFTKCSSYIFDSSNPSDEKLNEEWEIVKRFEYDSIFRKEKNFGVDKKSSYIEILDQAAFHPRKFTLQLADRVSHYGGLIFENTPLLEIVNDGDKKIAITPKGKIFASYVIMASQFNKYLSKEIINSFTPANIYVTAAKISNSNLLRGLYWDINLRNVYFRIDPKIGYQRLLLGLLDYEKDINKSEKFDYILDYIRKIIPEKRLEITNMWSDKVYETRDGFPYIGKTEKDPNIFISTGFGRNGMVYGIMSGIIQKDIILGHNNSWIDFYSPHRLNETIRKVDEKFSLTKEFLHKQIKDRYENKYSSRSFKYN